MANISLKAQGRKSMADSNEIKQTPIPQEDEQFEGGFTPIVKFSQDFDNLSKSGKLEYPKYRTLSQEQSVSYIKLNELPEYKRLQMKNDIKAASSPSFIQDAKNSFINTAVNEFSIKDRIEMWLGNMLVTEDYSPAAELAVQLGAVAKGVGPAALFNVLSPTEMGDSTLRASLDDIESAHQNTLKRLKESFERGEMTKEVYEQNVSAYEQQYQKRLESLDEISPKPTHEIKGEEKEKTKLQQLGLAMIKDSLDSMEYRTAVLPTVNQDSWGSLAGSATASVLGYFTASLGGRALGRGVAKPLAKRAKQPHSQDVKDRYVDIVGTKGARAGASAFMFNEVMAEGALSSIEQYIEDTGDVNLDNYTGDLSKVGYDIISYRLQDILEDKIGFGRFINKRIASKYGEWLNGFAQEFTQGEVSDIFEWIKGNQTFEEVIKNIPNNIKAGIIGAPLQGIPGTAYYTYHHNKTVNELTDAVMSQSTPEKPLDQKKVRSFVEDKVRQLEEGAMIDMAKELSDFSGATQYRGKIYDTIRDNVEKTINYQREVMKDTLEGSKYDDMSEEELAQHIEAVAQDNADRAVIDALERKVPLSESPLLKGETLEGTYYVEGSDYAKETERQAQENRQMIRDAVYAAKQAEKSAKEAANEAKKIAKEQAKQANSVKTETKKAITGGNVDVIGSMLSDAGFKVRDMSGSAIKELAKLNWQLFQGKDLGTTMSKYDKKVAMSAIEQNVESGNDVLLRAGYTKEQIDKMDDATWNRAVLTAYREESPAEPELTEEDLAGIPDDLQYQDEVFKIAEENASLDEIFPEHKGDTIVVNGVERTVYNSNGERIAKSAEALTNFWNWFGDSKVVDEDGRPLVVYHGTNAEFNSFNKSRTGIFFNTTKKLSELYGSKVYFAYLKMENPFVVPKKEFELNGIKLQPYAFDTINIQAQKMGYDGVINKDVYDSPLPQMGSFLGDNYSVFEPNQIKSTQNRGTFSPDTGNIYYQDIESEADQLEFERKIAKRYFDDFNEDIREKGLRNFVKEDGVYKNSEFFPAIEINSKSGESAAYDPETQTISISIKGLKNMTESDIVDFIREHESEILQRIQHESKHFYDIAKGATISRIRQLLMKVSPELYYNTKLEADAFMQEMLSGIAQNFNSLNAATKHSIINLNRNIYIDNMYKDLLKKHTAVKAWGKKNTEIFKKRLGEQFDLFKEQPNRLFYQDRQRGKGGAYDARTRSITLGGGANVTTFFHEFAHYWIDKNFKWARSGKASTAWMQQWRMVEKWLGIDPEDKYLDKIASEKFARAYERFLAEEELPLVLKKAMIDYRDFVLDHYDYELDDAKGLQDKLGRPIRLDDSIKAWFKKSIYQEYMSPAEMEVVNERLALDDQERKDIIPQLEEASEMQAEIANSPELNKIDITGGQIQREAGISNAQILGKRTIGGGEEKVSKGKIAQELGKTYESTNWDIQEQMVSEYLETVSLDEAIDDLDNETYPEKIDANFLRQALVERLLESGRELEAVALIEQTADDFTQAAQTLQAARKINTPFTNAIRMLTVGKAEKLAQARYGRNENAVAELDKAMNALIDKYQSDFMNAQTEEERELVYATMQDEAIKTIGTLDKSRKNDLDFQDTEDKEERKQAKAIRKQQIRRASINGYRSRAKRALKQALGLEPTRQQVRDIKKLSVEVAKQIRDFRKAVNENKTSAIDPTKVLVAQNKLNEYMNKQLPPRVLSTVADATNSFMMANMLWNPATNVFNLESTWVQMIPHMLATRINYGGGTIAWSEKVKLIKQALALQAKTGYNIFSLRDFFDKKTIWAEKYYEPTTLVGKAQRFPLTALGLMDTMNKGVVFLTHADSMATKQAKEEGAKNGWNKEQVAKRAKELFYQALNTDPRTITIDGLKIRKAAVQEGEEATFTQMTKTAELVNKFRKMLNLGGKTGLGNIIMPFTTTVANIAEDTVLNYGLGSVRGLVKAPQAIATQFDKTATAEMKKEAWKAVQPETKNVIKNMIGILMILGVALSGTDDDEYVLGYDRQTDMDKDIRTNRNAPYGYAVKIGDKWVDLDLFGIGSPWAKMYLIAKRYGFSTDGWVKGIASNIDLIPGVGELSSMYEKYTTTQERQGSAEAWVEMGAEKLEELSVRLIPMSALFGQLASVADDKKRETWNNWYDKMLAKIPYAREKLPARTSTQTGKELPQTDTIWNLATGQRIKDYIEPSGADKARYEFALEDKTLAYREGNSKLKELGKDTVRYKNAVNKVRKLFSKKLSEESKKASYKRLSIEEKKKVANKLHKEALESVKAEYGLAKKNKKR